VIGSFEPVGNTFTNIIVNNKLFGPIDRTSYLSAVATIRQDVDDLSLKCCLQLVGHVAVVSEYNMNLFGLIIHSQNIFLIVIQIFKGGETTQTEGATSIDMSSLHSLSDIIFYTQSKNITQPNIITTRLF